MIFHSYLDETRVEVDYDYQPWEKQTEHYPGCAENAYINGYWIGATFIDQFSDEQEIRWVEEILEWYAEKREAE